MPLYEYECESCGSRFERIQKFSDPLVTVCPTCGGPVRKLLSSPAIQFKGSGFYITDYAKSGASSGSDKSESEKSGSDKPETAGKSETGKSEKTDVGSSTPPATSSSDSSKPAETKKTESPAKSGGKSSSE